MKHLLFFTAVLFFGISSSVDAAHKEHERHLAHIPRDTAHPTSIDDVIFRHQRYILWLAGNDRETIENRKRYFKSLSEEEREKIRRAQKVYQDLPEDEKRKLREEWDKKPASEKANFRKWKEKRKN